MEVRLAGFDAKYKLVDDKRTADRSQRRPADSVPITSVPTKSVPAKSVDAPLPRATERDALMAEHSTAQAQAAERNAAQVQATATTAAQASATEKATPAAAARGASVASLPDHRPSPPRTRAKPQVVPLSPPVQQQNTIVFTCTERLSVARVAGLRFATVPTPPGAPAGITNSEPGVQRLGGGDPDQLAPVTLASMQPRALVDVRLMSGSGSAQNDGSTSVQNGRDWPMPANWSARRLSFRRECDDTDGTESGPHVQHQHSRDNRADSPCTPRHPAFDAMETKSNYRRLRHAGGVADSEYAWTDAGADARSVASGTLLSRPGTADQLARGDSARSTLGNNVTSFSDRRSHVSLRLNGLGRVHSSSLAATSIAARLGLASPLGRPRFQDAPTPPNKCLHFVTHLAGDTYRDSSFTSKTCH